MPRQCGRGRAGRWQLAGTASPYARPASVATRGASVPLWEWRPERVSLGKHLRVPVDLGRLLSAPLPQGRGECRIGDPVAAAPRRRQAAARDLVPALGAGLERRPSFAQAVFDALVVAGLEVQSRQRSEELRVGKECVRTWRARGAPQQYK